MAFYEKGKKLWVQLILKYKQGWKFTKPTIHDVRKKTFFNLILKANTNILVNHENKMEYKRKWDVLG